MQIVTFCFDSTDVLWWIQGSGKDYQHFVENRIGDIEMFTEPSQWRHVSTEENPTNLCTRGATPSGLGWCSLWWNGPRLVNNGRDVRSWSEFFPVLEWAVGVLFKMFCAILIVPFYWVWSVKVEYCFVYRSRIPHGDWILQQSPKIGYVVPAGVPVAAFNKYYGISLVLIVHLSMKTEKARLSCL